jgi:nicotinate-nucleotide adenylyltransferase
MRIAFFGGSFDPPHRGHLAIARAAIEKLSLDKVWMAPAGVQPLKRQGASTSYEDRLAMVELAVGGEPRICASAIDAPRNDGKPNYTIDVLASVHAGLSDGDRLFFLLGADSFLTLEQWHRAADLLFLSEFIVAGRPGFSLDDVAKSLPAGISAEELGDRNFHAGVSAWALCNEAGQGSALYVIPDLHEDISATEIRAALAGEHSAKSVLSPAVMRYIEARGLYR